jgi:hypothetical protein
MRNGLPKTRRGRAIERGEASDTDLMVGAGMTGGAAGGAGGEEGEATISGLRPKDANRAERPGGRGFDLVLPSSSILPPVPIMVGPSEARKACRRNRKGRTAGWSAPFRFLEAQAYMPGVGAASWPSSMFSSGISSEVLAAARCARLPSRLTAAVALMASR